MEAKTARPFPPIEFCNGCPVIGRCQIPCPAGQKNAHEVAILSGAPIAKAPGQ
jgi:hypothetical protein